MVGDNGTRCHEYPPRLPPAPPAHRAIKQVEAWEKRLGLMSETLDEWVAVQRNWMYLETIFCAEDIQKQLPEEAAKFQAVDKMWKVMYITRHQLLLYCTCRLAICLCDAQYK